MKINAAQPFILMVVQIGSTKRLTDDLTPQLFSAHFMVTGRVAADDFEKKATVRAVIIPLKTFKGLSFLQRRNSGRTTNICTRLAVITVAK